MKQGRPRALFFIPTLEVGGAERVCVHYVRGLQYLHPVLLLQHVKGPLLDALHPATQIHAIFYAGTAQRRDGLLHSIGRQVSKALRPLAMLARVPGLAPVKQLACRVWGACLSEFTRLFRLARKGPLSPLVYGYSLIVQARAVARIVRSEQASLLVSFLTLPNIIVVLASRLFRLRIPVVLNVHDVTSRLLPHSGLKPWEQTLLKWAVRLSYPLATQVLVASEGVRQDLMCSFGVPASRIKLAPNPVDIKRIRRLAQEPGSIPFVDGVNSSLVVAVGRLVKVKGFDVLIQAFASLPHGVDARLLIVGEGEERAALESLVEQLGLNDRIALVGFQDNPWRLMARATVFVLSSWTEAAPNVILEAMALGCPVIATDCSEGIRAYLKGGEAGLLVPPGDPDALAEALARLLVAPDYRLNLSEQGRRHAETHDLHIAVPRYEGVLLSLFRDSSDSPRDPGMGPKGDGEA